MVRYRTNWDKSLNKIKMLTKKQTNKKTQGNSILDMILSYCACLFVFIRPYVTFIFERVVFWKDDQFIHPWSQ